MSLRTWSAGGGTVWAAAVVVGAVGGLVRLLHFGRGYTNDHFVYITGGFQILTGELPTRDWVDGGAPLTVMASALAQAILGPTVLAEAVLTAIGFGLAASLTCLLVQRLTSSVVLAVLAAGLELAVMPRTYSYPKVLCYAGAFLCLQAYLRRPGPARMLVLAGALGAAFLARHDHGAFLAAGAAVAVWLGSGEDIRSRTRAVASLALLTFCLLLPYFVYVQMFEGIPRHFGIGVGLGQQEFTGRFASWPQVFGDETPFASALFYQYFALPVLALVLLVAQRRWSPVVGDRAVVAGVAVVGLLASATFLRAPLDVRLPDPVVPAVVVGAWLVHVVAGARQTRRAGAVLASFGVALFSASILEAGNTRDVLAHTGLLGSWIQVPALVGAAREEMGGRLPVRVWPSRAAERLQPFYAYLERCSTPEDRIIVGGFLVDVPFFARRPFAGGQRYFGGSYGFDPAAERLALERLSGQRATYAVLPSDAAAFSRAFPLLAAHLDAHYVPMAQVPVAGSDVITVYVDTRLVPGGVDQQTGWPCFVQARTLAH